VVFLSFPLLWYDNDSSSGVSCGASEDTAGPLLGAWVRFSMGWDCCGSNGVLSARFLLRLVRFFGAGAAPNPPDDDGGSSPE